MYTFSECFPEITPLYATYLNIFYTEAIKIDCHCVHLFMRHTLYVSFDKTHLTVWLVKVF